MLGANKNITKIYLNIYSCITLYCIAALFEAAFLSLTIRTWDIQSLGTYLILVFALQLIACLKASYIWRIHRSPIGLAYTVVAITSGLMMYLTIEVFRMFVPISLISIHSLTIASIDALLSVALLCGIRIWLQVILKTEPFQLSSQIRHHFLFNTLNTTVCRIQENPRLAQDNLERLADLLRKILFLKIYISLEEELATVKCYLGIEKYRLGDRLRVNWLVDYHMKDVIKVPALILQPLVENAIYYGIEKVAGGGTIVISLCTTGDRLIIQVRNPTVNIRCSHLSYGNHIAQANIAHRLALIYGNNFTFKHEHSEMEYRATINIPSGEL